MGPQGPQGATGATGPQGPEGPQGQTGLTGATGGIGPRGSVGAIGPKGDPGAPGTPGTAGLKGDNGDPGDTGPKGDTGASGSNGADSPLIPYVTVDTGKINGLDGPHIIFGKEGTGVNVHVRDGSGGTDGAVNGLGNLIVGYNEDSGDTRSGSHNLVVGQGRGSSSRTDPGFGGRINRVG